MRPPLLRATAGLLYVLSVIAALVLLKGVRADLAAKVTEPSFVLPWIAAAITGVCATIAAFYISLPDRSRLWSLLPLPALALWISTMAYGCLFDWVELRDGMPTAGETFRCFGTVVGTSLPLALVLLYMLHYAAHLRSTTTAVVGALAIASFTADTLMLIHQLDATALILAWNVGTLLLLVLAGRVAGQKLFALVDQARLSLMA